MIIVHGWLSGVSENPATNLSETERINQRRRAVNKSLKPLDNAGGFAIYIKRRIRKRASRREGPENRSLEEEGSL